SLMFPVVARVLKPGGLCVPLIKPQFEAGRDEIGKGGVVRESRIHRSVLERTMRLAEDNGLGVLGLVASPLQGPAGNIEFLAHLKLGARSGDVPAFIDEAMSQAAPIGASE
nr:TlyA family rRNA (cytidine-2'-O)-methyltransferase [Chloroflexia bacterium]